MSLKMNHLCHDMHMTRIKLLNLKQVAPAATAAHRRNKQPIAPSQFFAHNLRASVMCRFRCDRRPQAAVKLRFIMSGRITGKKDYSGHYCQAPGCQNSSGKDKVLGIKDRHYYGFPLKDKQRLRSWMKLMPRKGWSPSTHSKICSDHFVGGIKTRKKGTPGYIPTLYPGVDEELGKKKEVKKRKSKTSVAAGSPVKPEPEPEPKPKKLTPKVIPTALGRPVQDNIVWTQPPEHDYINTRSEKANAEDEWPRRYLEMERKLEELSAEVETYRKRILSLHSIKDSSFQVWTNLPNRAVFDSLVGYLKERAGGGLKYWRGSSQTTKYEKFKGNKPGPDRKVSFEDEFFIVLVRLKTGFQNNKLEHLLAISESLISQIFTTWLNFLYFELKILFEMPQFENDDFEGVADCFKDFPNLEVVLDCTEIKSQKSSDLQARKEMYSNYKGTETIKFMVGLSSQLNVNYVSKAFGGRASDKFITLNSPDLLENLPPGCKVMSDKGFNLEQELKELGVELIIPSFKGRGRSQMSRGELAKSEWVAKARIHVERIIQRIRTFHILATVAHLSMKDIHEQIFTVCAYLTNFQLPIVR